MHLRDNSKRIGPNASSRYLSKQTDDELAVLEEGKEPSYLGGDSSWTNRRRCWRDVALVR